MKKTLLIEISTNFHQEKISYILIYHPNTALNTQTLRLECTEKAHLDCGPNFGTKVKNKLN